MYDMQFILLMSIRLNSQFCLLIIFSVHSAYGHDERKVFILFPNLVRLLIII